MLTVRTTSRLLTAYADKESWQLDHGEAQTCLDVEEKLAWGVPIFRGLLDLEARAQAHAFKHPGSATDQLTDLMPLFYRLWADASEFYLRQARELVATGFAIEGLDEFAATVEEARCLVDNLNLEEQIRPIEELTHQAKPVNPRPERYRD